MKNLNTPFFFIDKMSKKNVIPLKVGSLMEYECTFWNKDNLNVKPSRTIPAGR